MNVHSVNDLVGFGFDDEVRVESGKMSATAFTMKDPLVERRMNGRDMTDRMFRFDRIRFYCHSLQVMKTDEFDSMSFDSLAQQRVGEKRQLFRS